MNLKVWFWTGPEILNWHPRFPRVWIPSRYISSLNCSSYLKSGFRWRNSQCTHKYREQGLHEVCRTGYNNCCYVCLLLDRCLNKCLCMGQSSFWSQFSLPFSCRSLGEQLTLLYHNFWQITITESTIKNLIAVHKGIDLGSSQHQGNAESQGQESHWGSGHLYSLWPWYLFWTPLLT